MCASWIQRVGSTIPRGFSRYYILDLLKKKPLSGKEIIDSATKQSEGKWKPSPGLIYPLLGRLLDEGLIEESKDGKYQISGNVKQTYVPELINNFLMDQRGKGEDSRKPEKREKYTILIEVDLSGDVFNVKDDKLFTVK